MKATLLPLLALLSLAGCHAARDTGAAPAVQTAAKTSTATADGKAQAKVRDQLMDKSMSVQDQHWASTDTTPVAASSSTGTSAGMGAQPATTPSDQSQ